MRFSDEPAQPPSTVKLKLQYSETEGLKRRSGQSSGEHIKPPCCSAHGRFDYYGRKQPQVIAPLFRFFEPDQDA